MTNPFTRLFRARDKPGRRASPKNAVSAAPTFYFGSSVSGKSVTARSAIQGPPVCKKKAFTSPDSIIPWFRKTRHASVYRSLPDTKENILTSV